MRQGGLREWRLWTAPRPDASSPRGKKSGAVNTCVTTCLAPREMGPEEYVRHSDPRNRGSFSDDPIVSAEKRIKCIISSYREERAEPRIVSRRIPTYFGLNPA